MLLRSGVLGRLSFSKCIPVIRRSNWTSSSLNSTEVSHFDELASTWWDLHGSSSLLHQMNPLRHDFISECLQAFPGPPVNKRYLDIGCGGGIFAESAARLPHTKNVLAIDPSSKVINVAKDHARRDPLLSVPGRLTYENKLVEDMAAPTSSSEGFDIVTLFEVIEHIDSPSAFLESCLPFVRPGGWLILSTIARTWTSWLTTKLVAEDIAQVVPRGTHDWEKYINDEELRAWFRTREGWGLNNGIKSRGVIYVPVIGWRVVPGSQQFGNYFFGVRKDMDKL